MEASNFIDLDVDDQHCVKKINDDQTDCKCMHCTFSCCNKPLWLGRKTTLVAPQMRENNILVAHL